MSQNAIRRKLVIVGDGACGKTSLLTVFSCKFVVNHQRTCGWNFITLNKPLNEMGQFPDSYSPTVFDNFVADIQLDGKPVHLQLWDTAGQEEYERLRPLSYSKAHVILIAFSVDTPDSLDNVTNKWYEEVRSICGQHIPVILVGCKTDLREKARQNGTLQNDSYVETLEGERISKAIGARAYYECSSLLNQGVDDIFEAATRAAMLVRESGHGPSNPAHPRKDTPGGKQSTDEKHGKNCCLIN